MAFQKEHVLILSTYKWSQLHSTTKIALCHQTQASGLAFPKGNQEASGHEPERLS